MRVNKGAAGVDEQSIEDFEKDLNLFFNLDVSGAGMVPCGFGVLSRQWAATSDDPSVPCEDAKNRTVAVATIVDYLGGLVLPGTPTRGRHDQPGSVLAGFRRDLYQCLNRRADALFELAEAILCADGP